MKINLNNLHTHSSCFRGVIITYIFFIFHSYAYLDTCVDWNKKKNVELVAWINFHVRFSRDIHFAVYFFLLNNEINELESNKKNILFIWISWFHIYLYIFFISNLLFIFFHSTRVHNKFEFICLLHIHHTKDTAFARWKATL